MMFMFGLQHPLTCNPSTTFSNLTNKVRGKMLLKKSSCVFLLALSFMRLSFCMRPSLLLLSRYDTENDYVTLSRFGACARRVLQGLRMNLVTVNCSFRHHNTTATKRTKKDAGIERSKTKKKQEKPATEKRKERTKNCK